jgi:hypothetical protein
MTMRNKSRKLTYITIIYLFGLIDEFLKNKTTIKCNKVILMLRQ